MGNPKLQEQFCYWFIFIWTFVFIVLGVYKKTCWQPSWLKNNTIKSAFILKHTFLIVYSIHIFRNIHVVSSVIQHFRNLLTLIINKVELILLVFYPKNYFNIFFSKKLSLFFSYLLLNIFFYIKKNEWPIIHKFNLLVKNQFQTCR